MPSLIDLTNVRIGDVIAVCKDKYSPPPKYSDFERVNSAIPGRGCHGLHINHEKCYTLPVWKW